MTRHRHTPSPRARRQCAGELWRCAAVTALAVGCYVPTLFFDFVWDDPISVRRWLPALQTWRDFFFPPPNIPQFPADYYRPLQLLSYALDAKLGSGAPWAFHASSVVWHTASTALVFATAHLLFASLGAARSSVALVAAALFAVHPVHTESVAWMAARPDPMVATFGLAALCVALRAIASLRVLLVGGALLGAALLSKENAVGVCILVPLGVRLITDSGQGGAEKAAPRGQARGTQPPRGSLAPWQRWAVCSAIVLVLYSLLRWLGLAELPSAEMQLPQRPVATLLAALGFYVRKLLWPFPQSAYLAEVPVDALYLAMGAVALTGLALLGWPRLYRRAPAEAFCGLWIVLTLLPSLVVLVRPPTAPLAERYLYVASVGFCWLAARAAVAVSTRVRILSNAALRAIAALIVMAGVASTWVRAQVWRDNISLWADTAQKNPNDGFAQRNLGAALLERGRLDEAERELRQALEKRNTAPGLHGIYSNLGTLALQRQQWEQAEQFYRQALAVMPGAADVVFNLGVAILARAESLSSEHPERRALLEEARESFAKTAAASPFDPDAQVALGHVLTLLERREEALAHYSRALELGLSGERAAEVRRRIAEARKARGRTP